MVSFQSVSLKVFGIGLLTLLMLIPLFQVQGLIEERRQLRDQAVGEIANRWGAAQTLGGPVLVVPKKYKVKDGNGWALKEVNEIMLSDSLNIGGSMVAEERHYGIYSTPVYTSELTLRAVFLPQDLQMLERDDTEWHWAQAELRLPLSDVRGLRRVDSMYINEQEMRFVPSSGGVASLNAIAVPLDLTERTTKYVVEIKMTLAGTETLQFLPFARKTEIQLSAPWGDPSFVGAFLPAERKIDDKQFEARWQVLDLNREFSQHWEESNVNVNSLEPGYSPTPYAGVGSPTIKNMAFGVELYQPAGLYQQNTRAGKYGLLFIGLTFVAFFLFEILKKLRVHPVQYLLIGLALCTFYIVLLALSEQIGFSLAYLAAACSVIMMIGGYASSMLDGRKAGFMIGAMLTLVYGVLYGLIVSEQYSLSLGALMLLVVIGLLMYLTRRIDWYAIGQRTSAPQPNQQ